MSTIGNVCHTITYGSSNVKLQKCHNNFKKNISFCNKLIIYFDQVDVIVSTHMQYQFEISESMYSYLNNDKEKFNIFDWDRYVSKYMHPWIFNLFMFMESCLTGDRI